MKRADNPLQNAVAQLWLIAASIATPQQIKETADRFDLEAWQLEGAYFESIDAAGNE